MQAWVRRLAMTTVGGAALTGALAGVPVGARAATVSVSLHASRIQIRGGQRVVLSGRVAGAPPNRAINIDAVPYPYRDSRRLASVAVTPTGTFSYTAAPNRNTVYRARLAGGGAQAKVKVLVSDRTLIRIRALTLGRAQVTVLAFHPRDLRWNRARVRWSFGRWGRSRAPITRSGRSRRLGPHITVLRMIVALPAGRFSFRLCFHASGDQALDNPGRPRGCSGRGYRGGGRLPVGFPGPQAVARAERALRARGTDTGLAVVDSEGRLSGVNLHTRFITGSVVKAMLLVAYLRRLHDVGQHRVDAHSNSILYPMIHVSDNGAASRTMSYVGAGGLYDVAHAAGMTGAAGDRARTSTWSTRSPA